MEKLIAKLIDLQTKPDPFTPGEPLFWDDPYISSQMLKAHLDIDNDAASRRPEIINQIVAWLIEQLGLQAGDSILDLGCGPGLYATRFARAGLQVTGVDYSHRSIEYAIQSAKENNLEIEYRYQNYLELEEENQYDVAFLIYGDFCPLNPQQRVQLLKNVYRSLKSNGKFVLDVTTREHRKEYGNRNKWKALESGFWKSGPHLVLEEGFDYPEQSIWLDQYITIEPDVKISVYRNWFQDYTPESIRAELEHGGFQVESVWGDLTGQAYTSKSEWIGLITRKH